MRTPPSTATRRCCGIMESSFFAVIPAKPGSIVRSFENQDQKWITKSVLGLCPTGQPPVVQIHSFQTNLSGIQSELDESPPEHLVRFFLHAERFIRALRVR